MIGMVLAPFSHKADDFFRQSGFSVCSKGALRIVGIKLQVEGTPPKPPFYLVSNHVSFIDIFVIASQLGCVFVSKAELADYPILGFISRNLSTIYIRREDMRDTHRVNQEITTVMNDGHGVVVFPEGTTTQSGYLLEFKPALLQPAVDFDMPVHVASIHYATPDEPGRANRDVLWRDGMTMLDHILKVAALRSCTVTLTFGEETAQSHDRKELAGRLHAAVDRIYTPIL